MYIPVSDAVGEVVVVAESVTRVQEEDRVSPLFAPGWISGPRPTPGMLGAPINGVAREFGAFQAESLCRTPDSVEASLAATLPCSGLTA